MLSNVNSLNTALIYSEKLAIFAPPNNRGLERKHRNKKMKESENEKKHPGRGGARKGAGRKPTDSVQFCFQVGGEVKERITQQQNKSAFIIECIRQYIEREKQEMDKPTAVELALRAENARPVAMGTETHIGFYDLSVACGRPDITESAVCELIDLNELLCHGHEGCYVFYARGESMVDAYIHPGDMLIVDTNEIDTDGNYAMLCNVNGENTVKYVKQQGAKCTLYPANEDYESFEVDSRALTIVGRIIKVIHPPLRRDRL